MLVSGVRGSGVGLWSDRESNLAAGRDLDVVLLRGDEDAGVLAGDAAVKVDVLYDSGLIDLESSVVPAVRDTVGQGVLVVCEIARRVDADDGGLDGNGLPALEDGFSEADGEMGFAGSV